jgi:hypothetical protein
VVALKNVLFNTITNTNFDKSISSLLRDYMTYTFGRYFSDTATETNKIRLSFICFTENVYNLD